MLKKLAHYAAVALLVGVPVCAVTACDVFSSGASEIGSIVAAGVPTNVAQGATMFSTILNGLANGLSLLGIDISTNTYFVAAQNAATAMAAATSADTGGSNLQQGEAALNALVASVKADCALPAGSPGAIACGSVATGLLDVAIDALPVVEALVPLPAGAHAPMAMAAPSTGLTPAQAYAQMQQLAHSGGLLGKLGL